MYKKKIIITQSKVPFDLFLVLLMFVFLFRTGEPNISARNTKTGKAGNFQFWEWFSYISDFGITFLALQVSQIC